MKLMDKFHSPKIKRTPSKKGKQQQPEPMVKAAEKPVNKNVSRLEEHEKEVVSALRYFKTIVDKMVADKRVLEMLPGSASKVLEAILPLVQVEPRIQQSSAVSSCHNRVYQSLANLIRWSDQVMLEGVNLDDKETVVTVTVVIKAVLDGVKELVKLTIEKQEHPSPASPTSPVKQISPACKSEITTELPLTEREKEILHKTTPMTRSLEILPDAAEEDVAPPKPPLPGIKINEHSPPALPPKKRQSAPSPTRVAVVAPMSRTTSGSSLPIGISKQEYDQDCLQRRLSGGSRSYGGESPRLSPCNSIGKLSKSDEQLSSLQHDSGRCSRNTSCETLVQQYMQFLEDYSEPQPSVFYQTPQSESIYEQRNKRFQEAYGFNDSFSSTDSVHELLPPPRLPPKQRQLASYNASSSSSSSSLSCHVQHAQAAVPVEDANAALSLSMSVSNSFLSRHSSFTAPSYKSVYRSYSQDFAPHNQASIPPFLSPVSSHFTTVHQSQSLDLAAPATAGQSAVPGGVANGSQDSSGGSLAVCPPSEPSLPDTLQTSVSESANEEGGEGEYVNLYSSSQVNGELPHSRGDPAAVTDDALPDPSPQKPSTNSKENAEDGRRQKSTDSDHSDEEVDELSLIDHKEIMTRITLKQEVRDRVCASDQDLSAIIEHVEPSLRSDDGPDVRAGSGDILLVHATETDRKDTFKKRVSKNTFFVLVRVVDELCFVELTDDILKQLMDLVFRLVCSGELSLARVLRKNILDKVDQKKQLRYINSMKPLAARGVAARVRSIIILQEKAQDREKLLLKFIKIMKHLRKLNNFNSYLAILSALDSAPIRRLEWQKQTSEGLEEYCTLIDSSSSFRAYRAALAEVEPPCIPYLGLILQDLTFVHLGNPDLIDGKVNFSKRWQQFNILDSMRRFQQVHYELKRNDDIVSFFNDFSDHLAEEALWELSLKIKPRNITRRKTEREEKT
ncbi:UNVERIFIED_CONTAM: hypothetical protein FKN15_021890 [Acipenser sinensis]